ncbi:hypothetical protein Tco_0752026 [Tanacetum coccineum]|uniref:Uncharacterized protein n=1 Tax=Tanacetum coccineum TaxID=301880 RepID=A0ABQ4Z5U2_9ASTR
MMLVTRIKRKDQKSKATKRRREHLGESDGLTLGVPIPIRAPVTFVDLANRNSGDLEFLTPPKRLLNSIDIIETVKRDTMYQRQLFIRKCARPIPNTAYPTSTIRHQLIHRIHQLDTTYRPFHSEQRIDLYSLNNVSVLPNNTAYSVKSIRRAAGEWFKKDCIGPVTTWEDFEEKFINGNLFDYETPLYKAFNDFNYLLKIDTNLFNFDIQGIKTYEEYELNNTVTRDLEEPWLDNGVPYQLCDYICEPYHFKNGMTKWPTCSSDIDGFCNGGELPGMVRVGSMTYFEDHKWYDKLADGKLKEETLMHKAKVEESWGNATPGVMKFCEWLINSFGNFHELDYNVLLGGARRLMTWRQFILELGLHSKEEMAKAGFRAYWSGSEGRVGEGDRGRKSGARLSGGHFIGRLAAHFGLVGDQGLRGGSGAAEDAPAADEGAQAVPAPVQAPQPPPPAPQPRTMSQRIKRMEEEMHKLRQSVLGLQGVVESSITKQTRVST